MFDEIISQATEALIDEQTMKLPLITDIMTLSYCLTAIVNKGGKGKLLLVLDNASYVEELCGGLLSVLLRHLSATVRCVLIDARLIDNYTRTGGGMLSIFFGRSD